MGNLCASFFNLCAAFFNLCASFFTAFCFKQRNCDSEPIAVTLVSSSSPIGNVSISAISPFLANRSRTTNVRTPYLMCDFRHEPRYKLCSTPIFKRVDDEPSKVPTMSLFDTIDLSDHREQQCNNEEIKQSYSAKNNLFEQPKTVSRCWITVFGYSISDKDEILSKFIRMVSCCDVRLAGPNWAHICFSNSADYHHALLLNACVSNNAAMIGVVPCNDKTLLNENISSIDSHPGPSTDILSELPRLPILDQQRSTPNDSIFLYQTNDFTTYAYSMTKCKFPH